MKRWWLAVAMGLTLGAGAVAKEAAVPVPVVGVVDIWDDESWIAIPAGQPVQGRIGVVTVEGTYQCCYSIGPQKTRRDNRFVDRESEETVWHQLTPLNQAKGKEALGLAVLARDAVAASSIPNGTQFTWRGRSYRLTQCASSEGVHLMLDSDGRRLRHYYYYLGYDTESDCDERELHRPEQPS